MAEQPTNQSGETSPPTMRRRKFLKTMIGLGVLTGGLLGKKALDNETFETGLEGERGSYGIQRGHYIPERLPDLIARLKRENPGTVFIIGEFEHLSPQVMAAENAILQSPELGLSDFFVESVTPENSNPGLREEVAATYKKDVGDERYEAVHRLRDSFDNWRQQRHIPEYPVDTHKGPDADLANQANLNGWKRTAFPEETVRASQRDSVYRNQHMVSGVAPVVKKKIAEFKKHPERLGFAFVVGGAHDSPLESKNVQALLKKEGIKSVAIDITPVNNPSYDQRLCQIDGASPHYMLLVHDEKGHDLKALGGSQDIVNLTMSDDDRDYRYVFSKSPAKSRENPGKQVR